MMSPKLKNLSKDFDFELYSPEIKKSKLALQLFLLTSFIALKLKPFTYLSFKSIKICLNGF